MTFGMFDIQWQEKARQSDMKYEGNVNRRGEMFMQS